MRGLYEKHFYFKMLITFEPNVAQRSVASQNDHKSKASLKPPIQHLLCRRLERRLRRLYEAPFFGASQLYSGTIFCSTDSISESSLGAHPVGGIKDGSSKIPTGLDIES